MADARAAVIDAKLLGASDKHRDQFGDCLGGFGRPACPTVGHNTAETKCHSPRDDSSSVVCLWLG
jgi:hypothetical protein